ncbi:MAG: hypothetical protein HWD61_11200 [Parachlamydiaceae bacterium]|nr:MAG: hypothetical protein HWD61_11200 [Parachlamydiaceae bacterium]
MYYNFFLCSDAYSQDINIKSFEGKEILPYVKEITELCLIIYKEYPFLYEGTEAEYLPFIEYYAQSDQSIACIVFDHARPVGVAIGMPLHLMREKYQTPFSNLCPNEILSEFFYLGEFLLLHEYRGQNLGKQMYLEFERLIQNKDQKNICFCSIDETLTFTPPPLNYHPLEEFWCHLGYQKCKEMTFSIDWRNISESQDSSHPMIYWIKKIR